MPSGVPLAAVLSLGNAFLFALNIFWRKNPVAYMMRQYGIEMFD